MTRSLSRFCWLGLLGMVCSAGTVDAQQLFHRPPLNIDVDFHFEVRKGPEVQRPTAPWYAYFPMDPRMMPGPQVSPYPPWPAVFPPGGRLPIPMNNVPRSAGLNAPGNVQASLLWPTPGAAGTASTQPIGYVPSQTPSYWYRNP